MVYMGRGRQGPPPEWSLPAPPLWDLWCLWWSCGFCSCSAVLLLLLPLCPRPPLWCCGLWLLLLLLGVLCWMFKSVYFLLRICFHVVSHFS